jgi:[citrate (pro-3S)-lyase] ligase
MNVEIAIKLHGARLIAWQKLLADTGLSFDEPVDRIALVWDREELIATAARKENLFKYIAVKPNRQGEDLTATVISALRADAFSEGYKHLFLYTKPENEKIFSSLFFYPIASTDKVLLMESRRNGIGEFISSLTPKKREGRVGAVVMNCNPFTLGHQYLVEKAAGECDHVYVFVLSEDKSYFSAKDRMAMVKLGTAHLENLTVLPTGPYLISSATFPAYFIKDKENLAEIQCLLDIEIFAVLSSLFKQLYLCFYIGKVMLFFLFQSHGTCQLGAMQICYLGKSAACFDKIRKAIVLFGERIFSCEGNLSTCVYVFLFFV